MPRSAIAGSCDSYSPQWLHQFTFPSAVEEGSLCSTFFFLAPRAARGILIPRPGDQGLNLCSLHWKCGVLTTGPPGKSPFSPHFEGFLSLSLFFLIEVQLIYNVVLVSGIQQSDSVIHIHIPILFQILFPFRLLQNIEFPVLYSRSLLVICFKYMYCVYVNPKLLIYLSSQPFPFGNHKFVF